MMNDNEDGTTVDGWTAAEFIECAINPEQDKEALNWRNWVGNRTVLGAADAARLMAGLYPRKLKEPKEHKSLDTDANDPAWEAKHRASKFEDWAAAQGMKSASPAEWLAWADAMGEPVHCGFRLAVEQYAQSAPAGKAATVAGPGTVRHSTKPSKPHFLAAQIRSAQAQAENASDAAARWERGAVWAALRAMALEESAPFTGMVDTKGLEYTDAANCMQVFTPAALAAYLKRQREK